MHLCIHHAVGKSNVEMSSTADSQQIYKRADVSAHNTEGDLWVIIDDKVYDLTEYMKKHPGGRKVLLETAGIDATKKYHKYHKPNTMTRFGDALCIGVVDNTDPQNGKRVWGKVRSTLFRQGAKAS